MNPAFANNNPGNLSKGEVKFADLHLHTFYSDGTYSPEELVIKAKKAGLSTIAIADHDTVDAIEPALIAAKEYDLEIIPGIELTAEHNKTEVHILGYFIDHKDKSLLRELNSLASYRNERIHKITDKLKEMGIDFDPKAVFDISGCGTVGRLHIARAMVKLGIISNTQEAFQKYIGDKCPAYVCGFRFSPEEAISLIKKVGGVAVLAHPYIFHDPEIITEFVKYGIDGLEVYYPEHTQSMINQFLDYAKKYNLLITGGSDCHGKAKPEVKIGMIKLPYEFVEKLKEASKR